MKIKWGLIISFLWWRNWRSEAWYYSCKGWKSNHFGRSKCEWLACLQYGGLEVWHEVWMPDLWWGCSAYLLLRWCDVLYIELEGYWEQCIYPLPEVPWHPFEGAEEHYPAATKRLLHHHLQPMEDTPGLPIHILFPLSQCNLYMCAIYTCVYLHLSIAF